MKFNKLIIYYFSGTGNAKNTAFWIVDEAKKNGLEAKAYNIAKINLKKVPTPAPNTLIGFISPTHGFHFPQIMKRFIRNFPKGESCSAFVANTRAGLRIGKIFMPGLSGFLHYWASIILRLKGFKIVGLYPVDLPSNWLSIHPALKKKSVKLIYARIEPKVRYFAKTIIDGGKNYRALYDLFQDIVIAPISILYMLFGKFFFSKSFIASSSCNLCEICKNSCPVQAIKKVDNRMFWTIKCESCMKCMNICPQKAIETAHGFIIVGTVILTSFSAYFTNMVLDSSLITDLEILENENIKSIINTVIFFPLMFAAYEIMHWSMRFKLFERLFVLSSLTQYGFWGRYKAPNRRIKRVKRRNF